MKRLCIIVGIVIALVLLVFVGKLLYKHFITDQIMDKDGMINPDYLMETDTTTSTNVTAFPITPEETGTGKLETISIQVGMIDEDDA